MGNLRQSMSQEEWDNMGKVINTPKPPTPTSPQKFCFRYDGSDEAKEALELINQIRVNEGQIQWAQENGCYFDSDTKWQSGDYDKTYTLVPPSEFIRLMKGEEWQPKSEAMCHINGKNEKVRILATNKKYAWIDRYDDNAFTIDLYELFPIRKSLREELLHLVAQHHSKHHQTITDEIIQLLKERGVEG